MSGLEHCCSFEWASVQPRIVRIIKSGEDRKKIQQNDFNSFKKKILKQREASTEGNTLMHVGKMQVMGSVISA